MRLPHLAVSVFVCLFGALRCSESEFHDDALQNPGKCPPPQWLTRCSTPVSHECTVDVDCGESANKCCFNGCYMTCHAATKRENQHKQRMCETPVDLVIMIDSSESVGLENFNSIRKMVEKVLILFTSSEKKTRVGIIMIDSVPHIELNFNTLKGANITKDHVMKVVRSLQFFGGQTRIDLALRMARKEVFSKAGGGRKDSQKILLVFTDGAQTWDHTMLDLKQEARALMKTGVEIFPVAVWDKTLNVGTLLDMAPNSRNVFNKEFYPDLLALLKKISKHPCSGAFLQKNTWKNALRKKTKKD